MVAARRTGGQPPNSTRTASIEPPSEGMEIPMTEERTEDEGVPAPDEPIEGADELPADVRDGDVSDVEDAPE
jgi:hypothetical protein